MKKKVFTIAMLVLLVLGQAGCAMFQSGIHDLHGSIVGNEYNIDIFDNMGIRTLRSHGEKIDIDNNIVEERSYSSDSNGWYTTKTLSSVITITIDGKQLISCGDTCIFYDTRLAPEYEFYLDEIDSSSSGVWDATLISGKVNSVKNAFGKPMVVVIKSQMGAPIYAFSGNKVYWEVQEDLPKFTKLMIDGKALYIHRANFQIIDKALLD
ncbi:MAG: DUF5052 family protein [Clostridia bacterium]|nr:DUF5052 family protein [Clostridia bacterium]